MYATHQPQIAKFARQNPDNFAKVLRFVIFTIQQQLSTAVKQSTGEQAANAFGFKLKALAEIERDKKQIFDECQALYCAGDKVGLLDRLTKVHGLGLVKAGFVCQLVYGFAGCIDTHNLKLYNIKLSQVTLSDKLKEDTRLKKISQYISLCDKLGGTEHLWNYWCQYVADNQPTSYKSEWQVSKLHVDAIVSK